MNGIIKYTTVTIKKKKIKWKELKSIKIKIIVSVRGFYIKHIKFYKLKPYKILLLFTNYFFEFLVILHYTFFLFVTIFYAYSRYVKYYDFVYKKCSISVKIKYILEWSMFATSSVSPINNLIKNLFELCIIVKEGVTSKSLLPWI